MAEPVEIGAHEVAGPDRHGARARSGEDHVAGLEGAHSTEFDRGTPHPVIALITEWQDQKGTVESRDERSNLGGTMRLGAQEIRLSHGSRAHAIYARARPRYHAVARGTIDEIVGWSGT